MPFRIIINGLSIECDTPEELLALTNRQAEAPAGRRRGRPPKQTNTIPGQSSDRRGFVGYGKAMLEALKEAYPSALTTPKLVARMGIRSAQLPSIIMGARSRAKHEGLDFNSLVKKEIGLEKGISVSSYQITEKGIEALQKYGH